MFLKGEFDERKLFLRPPRYGPRLPDVQAGALVRMRKVSWVAVRAAVVVLKGRELGGEIGFGAVAERPRVHAVARQQEGRSLSGDFVRMRLHPCR